MPSGIYIRKNGKTEIICKFCGKKKSLFTYMAKSGQKYCSRSCYWKDMKGRDPKHLPDYKGSVAWNRGKKMPELTGEKSLFWKGGISFEPYGIEFNRELRETIRKRDNYRCQECFRHQDELYSKSGRKYKLMIHHIDYNKTNNNENNLISLCRNCHVQTNWNRDNWINYYKGKLQGA